MLLSSRQKKTESQQGKLKHSVLFLRMPFRKGRLQLKKENITKKPIKLGFIIVQIQNSKTSRRDYVSIKSRNINKETSTTQQLTLED